jgi:hypothetical protein
MSSPTPLLYEDSLTARANVHKRGRIGNPYAFLNSVGINPILERIYKAANIVDIAEELNISITILLNWLENEGHMQRVEEATKLSAEGYLSEAAKALRTAKTDFELKKADKLANHGRFMASKLDKSKYGADNKVLGNTAGVTFIMHMGDRAPKHISMAAAQNTPPPPELGFIKGDYKLLPASEEEAYFNTPAHVLPPDDIGPFEDVPFEPTTDALPEYLKDAP